MMSMEMYFGQEGAAEVVQHLLLHSGLLLRFNHKHISLKFKEKNSISLAGNAL